MFRPWRFTEATSPIQPPSRSVRCSAFRIPPRQNQQASMCTPPRRSSCPDGADISRYAAYPFRASDWPGRRAGVIVRRHDGDTAGSRTGRVRAAGSSGNHRGASVVLDTHVLQGVSRGCGRRSGGGREEGTNLCARAGCEIEHLEGRDGDEGVFTVVLLDGSGVSPPAALMPLMLRGIVM